MFHHSESSADDLAWPRNGIKNYKQAALQNSLFVRFKTSSQLAIK